MARLPIVIAPHQVLKTKAKSVEKVDDSIRQLMDDMLETMYAAPGIGLSANQIGILQRVVVLDVARENEPPQPLKMVNPEILWQSEELSTYNEGCLSIPELYADVTRPAQIKFRFLDPDGKKREMEATGLLATCVQHEIDHLDGILFIDHISALKRNMILRKLAKVRKAQSESAM
ncbi:MAG TPA: peptide deformylase [Aliidongia sp.]|nr:peptide deformylase [Aliidongia sp.]